MSIQAKVPILPRETRRASLEAIYVSQGQWVARDETLFDIETEKVVLEIIAEQSGIIDEILVNQGDAVEAEQVILTIREPTEQELEDIPAAKADAKGKTRPEPEPHIIHGTQCSSELIEVNVPLLPESVQDPTLCRLNVAKDDWVEFDDILFEIETDKVVLEIPAPYSGVICDIKVALGEPVVAEQLVLTMKERFSDAPSTSPSVTSTKTKPSKQMPKEPAPYEPAPYEQTPYESAPDEPTQAQGSHYIFYGIMAFVVFLILIGIFFT